MNVRFLGALLLLLAASRPAFACLIVTEVPQTLIRRSAIVAEGIATSDEFTFELTKFWKGSTATNVRVSNVRSLGCETPPTVPGTRYLIAVETIEATAGGELTVLTGRAQVYVAEGVQEIFDYLQRPIPVSREQLIAMLEGWHDGRISDGKLRAWIRDVTPLAQVDDWTAHPGGEGEKSLAFHVLWNLNLRLAGLEENDGTDQCVLGVLKKEVAPVFLRLLRVPKPAAEELLALDASENPEERCGQQ